MPTALELGPAGWGPYLEKIRKRTSASAEREVSGLREALLVQARNAARALKVEHDARRVVLFGSLAHQAWFHAGSDVDVAVEGLPPAEYWAAWRLVERYFPERRVDLVEYETASESLRRAIDAEGVEL